MSVRHLERLFRPSSVAVIGASDRPASMGTAVLHHLVAAGFAGPIFPVNPKHSTLEGLAVHRSVAQLPQAPDLAIICTPPPALPGIVGELGAMGTRAVIVMTDEPVVSGPEEAALRQAMFAQARPHLLRVLGPASIGVLVPALRLNASLAPVPALPGACAFVAQSATLLCAMLDWACARQIGFSKCVSLGAAADVDFGDVLDYLASDPETHSIVLAMESLTGPRKFLSAARAAARNKPVLVLKAGRATDDAVGALATSDDVYDAAIRRAGMLRVATTEELFDALATLAWARPQRGERLAIVTNGRGPGLLAADALLMGGGRMASLAPETVAKLDALLAPAWMQRNPVDLGVAAAPESEAQVLDAIVQDGQVDATVYIHAPVGLVSGAAIAAALVPVIEKARRNVFACWLGGEGARAPRAAFAAAGIATYDTPEHAVRAFLQVVQYRRNQELLLEVPPADYAAYAHNREEAQAVVSRALDEGRSALTEVEAKNVLAAFGIPVAETRIAATVPEVARVAPAVGFPVTVKILSPDVARRADVGGVVLDLADADAAMAAARDMQARVLAYRPQARIDGFVVRRMVRSVGAHELQAGAVTDPLFGPVIVFGQGGTAVGVAHDRAVGLPPLNAILADDLIGRTRVARRLHGYRDHPAAAMAAINRTLVQVSHLVAGVPDIAEIDINPLFADHEGVIAVSARIRVEASGISAGTRFAIRPYPEELEERVLWQERELVLRPIRPEDGAQHLAFFNALAPEDVRYRAFTRMRDLPLSQLARLTQVDYDREMAFVATRASGPGKTETLGVVRAVTDPDNVAAEFAIIVRSDLKGQGLGTLLLAKLIAYCRQRGTAEITGEALAENRRVIALARHFGFTVSPAEEGTVLLRLELAPR